MYERQAFDEQTLPLFSTTYIANSNKINPHTPSSNLTDLGHEGLPVLLQGQVQLVQHLDTHKINKLLNRFRIREIL